ncbi:MAG TPA: Gfo/Idh/MocA family oxidoreductase, partial [Gillisia sp.]|nr:Gfo/Idh/MocA family oxidoreductase [Gillisia sp.]
MKRRDFVIKGSLGSLALAASTSVLGNFISFNGANDAINIGVIGTGDRGGGLIPLLNEIDGINVTACCDVLPFRLENGLAQAGNAPKAYTDYRNLLDNKDIDAVLIATPFNTHSQIAIDSIDAGKHVYSEKTMAKGYSGIHSLVQKASQSSQIFQTGHQ